MRSLSVSIAFLLAGCAAQQSSPLYDYYFPKRGETVASSVYRPAFDKLLSGGPSKDSRATDRWLYRALRGDVASAHAFLHSPDSDAPGEFGETWAYECLFLLVQLGDHRFASLLRNEDHRTREFVGATLEMMTDRKMHSFPETRALCLRRNEHITSNQSVELLSSLKAS